MQRKGAVLCKNHREYLCHFGGRPVELKKKKKNKKKKMMVNKKKQKFSFSGELRTGSKISMLKMLESFIMIDR